MTFTMLPSANDMARMKALEIQRNRNGEKQRQQQQQQHLFTSLACKTGKRLTNNENNTGSNYPTSVAAAATATISSGLPGVQATEEFPSVGCAKV